MRLGLDSFDADILEELRKNGRLSHSDLAKRVNLSRNAVRLRVERLEQDGFILGYTIIQDVPNDRRIIAMIHVFRHDRTRGGGVMALIKTFPEVSHCDVMSGDLDIVLRVEAKSVGRVQEIWDEISRSEDVSNTVTSFALSTHSK